MNKETITKDNIHLYYEFMSDEELEIHKEVIQQTFFTRLDKIKISCNIKNLWNFKHYNVLKRSSDLSVLSICIFGVKDTLKDINDYIKEIKNSKEYKEYSNI